MTNPLTNAHSDPSREDKEDIAFKRDIAQKVKARFASPEPVPATNQAGEVERAARAVLARWDGSSPETMVALMDGLRAALATQPATSQEGEGREAAMREAANALAPFSADAPATPTRLALVILNAAINQQSPLCQQIMAKLPSLALALAATPTPPTATSQEGEIFRLAANLVYRIEAAGALEHEGRNFERWKTTARSLAPSLRSALATQPATSQEDARGDFGVGQDELVAGFKRALQHPAGDHDGWTDAGMEDAFFRWPVIVNALNEALASNRTATSQEGEGKGWVAWNPDTGEEYTPNHPVESGECVEAENIRRATPQEDTLWQGMQDQFMRAEALAASLAATPTPPTLSEDLRALSERATRGEWRVAEGSVEDGSIYIDASENGECPVAMIMSGSPHNQDRADAAFIVAAVQYVLAQVKAS